MISLSSNSACTNSSESEFDTNEGRSDHSFLRFSLKFWWMVQCSIKFHVRGTLIAHSNDNGPLTVSKPFQRISATATLAMVKPFMTGSWFPVELKKKISMTFHIRGTVIGHHSDEDELTFVIFKLLFQRLSATLIRDGRVYSWLTDWFRFAAGTCHAADVVFEIYKLSKLITATYEVLSNIFCNYILLLRNVLE